jgi:hypothetical protein
MRKAARILGDEVIKRWRVGVDSVEWAVVLFNLQTRAVVMYLLLTHFTL